MTNYKSNTPKTDAAKKAVPKKITQTYLHNSGLYYLQKYSSSVENFRRVMNRKILKSCRHHVDQDMDMCLESLENVINNFIRAGLLDDKLYAEGRINSLRRSGQSKKNVLQKMQVKGLHSSLIEETLREIDKNNEDPEFSAALIFARRKRIGPYSSPDKEKDMMKQMSIFARAGFPYDISIKIIKMEKSDLN